MYIQTDESGRIVGISEGPEEGFFEYAGELPDEWNDYILVDSRPVFSEAPERAAQREAEAAAKAREEMLANLAQYQADTDAALCEVYESADKAQADTDAALCEIYELLIGGK